MQIKRRKTGRKTYDYSVSTDLSYDEGFSVEEKSVKFGAHAKVIVKIDDPKYGINGFYVADPTWDNNLEKDYYNHALMSFDKPSKERRMFRLSNEDLIMNVKNMEEFSLKVNFLIDHLINTITETASVVNKDVFGFNDDQASVYKEELLQMNIEMDKLQFPYYYDNSKIK